MTLGAVPVVPFRFFGDKFLETFDFLGRLDNECIKSMSILGLGALSPIEQGYWYGPSFREVALPAIKSIFVNRKLKQLPPEQYQKVKEKLKTKGWVFNADLLEPQSPSMYS